MPQYSYFCETCIKSFSEVSSISDYKEKLPCPYCKEFCSRDYNDLRSLSTSVKLSNSEIKTLGHLAQRNTENMSQDQKIDLHIKHNGYKYDKPEQALPKGMSRMKKTPKMKWTKEK